MKLFVLGATGATGRAFVQQAVSAGHLVTAYTRSPQKIAPRHPNITVVEGALSDAPKLKAALKGHDAVISTLGHNDLRSNVPMITHAMQTVLAGMAEHGITRLIYEGAYGTGTSHADLGFVFRVLIKPLFLKNSYADHEQAEALISRSQTAWTLVQPSRLTNGPHTGTYIARENLRGTTMAIARADVADFMLKQISRQDFVRKSVALAY